MPNHRTATWSVILTLCISFASAAQAARTPEALASQKAAPRRSDSVIDFGSQTSSGTDRVAIEALLSAYTSSVTDGDEARFRRLLLNEKIPFSGIGGIISTEQGKDFDDQDFKSFDDDIFKSGIRHIQTFHNVHILQDGALAQVSLDFVTRDARTGAGGWGWKVLQLLKVDGQWKIASEFYTGHRLPQEETTPPSGAQR